MKTNREAKSLRSFILYSVAAAANFCKSDSRKSGHIGCHFLICFSATMAARPTCCLEMAAAKKHGFHHNRSTASQVRGSERFVNCTKRFYSNESDKLGGNRDISKLNLEKKKIYITSLHRRHFQYLVFQILNKNCKSALIAEL